MNEKDLNKVCIDVAERAIKDVGVAVFLKTSLFARNQIKRT